MKVLIGYDDSLSAEAALGELRRAGLPREAATLPVSVADGLIGAYFPMAEIAEPSAPEEELTAAVRRQRLRATVPPAPRIKS